MTSSLQNSRKLNNVWPSATGANWHTIGPVILKIPMIKRSYLLKCLCICILRPRCPYNFWASKCKMTYFLCNSYQILNLSMPLGHLFSGPPLPWSSISIMLLSAFPDTQPTPHLQYPSIHRFLVLPIAIPRSDSSPIFSQGPSTQLSFSQPQLLSLTWGPSTPRCSSQPAPPPSQLLVLLRYPDVLQLSNLQSQPYTFCP